MITQLIRNGLMDTKQISINFSTIDSLIHNMSHPNQNHSEEDIIKQVCNAWGSFPNIVGPILTIGNRQYPTLIEFNVYKTHKHTISVTDSALGSYGTEYGDFAFLVKYYFDNRLVNRRLSVIQCKFDNVRNSVSLPIHQLYFMTYWPNVNYKNNSYKFGYLAPDQFSFYHIFLKNNHNPRTSSSFFSAPYISEHLGLNQQTLINQLKNWQQTRRTKPKAGAPSHVLNHPLVPPNSNYRTWWALVPKPFTRFMIECAYLWWGTDDSEALRLAQDRIKNIIILKVGASKDRRDDV